MKIKKIKIQLDKNQQLIFNKFKLLIVNRRNEISDKQLEELISEDELCEYIENLSIKELRIIIQMITIYAIGYSKNLN